MKKIILICSLLAIGLIGFSQSKVQRSNGLNTLDDPRQIHSKNLVIPVYDDTVGANTNIGIDSSGAIIKTRNPSAFWIRFESPKRWMKITDINGVVSSVTKPNDTTLRVCYTNNVCNDLSISSGGGVADTTTIAGIIRSSVFNSVADLKASNYYTLGIDYAFTRSYYGDTDRVSAAQYIWSDTSTATGDDIFAIKPTSVSGAGRWLYVPVNGVYNLRSLGCKNNSSNSSFNFDNQPIIQYVIDHIPTLTPCKIYLPASTWAKAYYCDTTITIIDKEITFYTDGHDTRMIFPSGTIGIHYTRTVGNDFATFENLQLYSFKIADPSFQYDGFKIEAVARIINCSATYFSGAGLRLTGSIAGSGTNVSGSYVRGFNASSCGDGIAIIGDDANAIDLVNIDTRDCDRYGIRNAAFLSLNIFGWMSHYAAASDYYQSDINCFTVINGAYWEAGSPVSTVYGRCTFVGGVVFQVQVQKGNALASISFINGDQSENTFANGDSHYWRYSFSQDAAGVVRFKREGYPENGIEEVNLGGLVGNESNWQNRWIADTSIKIGGIMGQNVLYNWNGVTRFVRYPMQNLEVTSSQGRLIQSQTSLSNIVPAVYYTGDIVYIRPYDSSGVNQYVCVQRGSVFGATIPFATNPNGTDTLFGVSGHSLLEVGEGDVITFKGVQRTVIKKGDGSPFWIKLNSALAASVTYDTVKAVAPIWKAVGQAVGTTTQRNALTLTGNDIGFTFYDKTLSALYVWSGSAWVSTGGSSYTASNGITLSTADFQLFGSVGTPATLSSDRYLTAADRTMNITYNSLAGTSGFQLSSTSTAAASNTQKVLEVLLSGANSNANQISYAGYFSNTHTGTNAQNRAIYGETSGASSVTAYFTSTNGVGMTAISSGGTYGAEIASTTGIGAYIHSDNGSYGLLTQSTGGVAFSSTAILSSTNTVVTVGEVIRATSGTAANGIGGSIDFQNEADNGSSYLSNQLISKLTTAANATRTSQFIITGVNSGSIINYLTLQPSYQLVNNDADTLATRAYARSIGGGTTITFGTKGQIPVTNPSTTGFAYSDTLKWDGANKILTVLGTVASGVSNGGIAGEFRSYQLGNTNYVSFYTDNNTGKSGIFRSNTDFFIYYMTSTGDTHIDATYNPSKIYFDAQGTSKMVMSASAFYPNTNGGMPLGTTTNAWGNVFLDAATKIDFGNGNFTITHASGKITTNGDVHLENSGSLYLQSLNTFSGNVTSLSQLIANSGNGNRVEAMNLGSYTYVTTSSAGTLTLAANSCYIFNGTTSTWTLPAVTNTTGMSLVLKNGGSGSITLNTNASGNDIYDTSAINTMTITAGQSIRLVSNGTYFYVVSKY